MIDWVSYGHNLAKADDEIGNLPDHLGAVRETRIAEYAAATIAEIVPDVGDARHLAASDVVEGYRKYVHEVIASIGAAIAAVEPARVTWDVGITATFAVAKHRRDFSVLGRLRVTLPIGYIAEWTGDVTETHCGVRARNKRREK